MYPDTYVYIRFVRSVCKASQQVCDRSRDTCAYSVPTTTPSVSWYFISLHDIILSFELNLLACTYTHIYTYAESLVVNYSITTVRMSLIYGTDINLREFNTT